MSAFLEVDPRTIRAGEHRWLSWSGVMDQFTYAALQSWSYSGMEEPISRLSEGHCPIGACALVPDGEWGRCLECMIRWRLIRDRPSAYHESEGPAPQLIIEAQLPLGAWLSPEANPSLYDHLSREGQGRGRTPWRLPPGH